MQQEHGVVTGCATYVYMLAKDGELFGQIAVQGRHFDKAWLGKYLAVCPFLEGVGTTTAYTYIEDISGPHEGVADLCQLPQDTGIAGLHVGADFYHALGNFWCHITRKRPLRQQM